MNHIYRVIWNASTACWQAVPENSRCHTKTKSKCVYKTASTTRYIRIMCLATLIGFLSSVGNPAAWAGEPATTTDAPPGPSSTSKPDEKITNPITGKETKVTKLLVDPPGTETAGKTAFVQTADGYTFLVKTAGEKFYNNDNPPVAFTIESVSGNNAVVTSKEAEGNATFTVSQQTTEFDKNFSSTGSEGELKPPENVTGPDGVKQVNYGRNGNNGRTGALFVPPSSGGNGQTGPLNRQTLSSNINATSGIGWEIGSVGGSGGKGGDSWLSFWNGRDGGNGGTGGEVKATQDKTSTIASHSGDKPDEKPGYGIFAYSRSGQAGKGGTGYAATGGGTGGHSSDGGEVSVSQQGTISTSGKNAHGIYALSVSNNGGNGGNQWGIVGAAGNGGYGGNGGKVNVNTSAGASILTQNDYSDGILAQSVGGSGGSAGSSENLLVSLIGKSDNGGNGNEVTVSSNGSIQTHGVASRGIMAQSIGGGGGTGGTNNGLIALALGGVGSNGGSGNKVSVTNGISGAINTTGDLADGIMAQSIGGSGGKGANAHGLVSIGGDGAKGGNGKDVTVENDGLIHTKGNGARGIVAQSIGGGGGDGGASGGMVTVGGNGKGGGSGATVNVTNKGVITTEGADSMGILAQSVGGGGGNGGSSGSVGVFGAVGIGGSGGSGGKGGDVSVTLSSNDPGESSEIKTSGVRSTGVFAQSVGGGGGNGGGEVSVVAGVFGAASVSIGGNGGNGGAGGTVTLTGTNKSKIETKGADSVGVLLQSVGGGGGNGGYSVSVAASVGPVSGSLAVGIGGSGGSGGKGGKVLVGTVDKEGRLIVPGLSGSVSTRGDRSDGMIFQSVGGGGGNGGLAVTADGSGSLLFSGSVSVSVGGTGNEGGEGGLVRVYTDTDITTDGNSSTALLVQSVGGGGGNGGGSIAAGVAGAGGGAGSVNVGVGGSGAGGGDGGVVNATSSGAISTKGFSSSGFVAQSIGGGGGNGGFDVSSGISGAGEGAGAISVGLGGSGKGGGNGAGVTAETTGTVETHGDMSTGVLVQSVGGGGGNGGFSVAAGVAGSGGGAGGVSVGLGGSAGKGGSGGVVKAKIKNNVETQGNRAAGVVTQSVGGGGGNGGFSVSGAVTGAGVGSGSVTVGLGGKGNGGGNGSMVDTTVDGSVTTQGTDAVAILAQSVGGGGGNGGFNVSGAISGSGMGSGAVSVGLGGSGGTGATGGMVTLTSNGDIRTQGARSSGFVAQSVGGGGGNGGFSIAGSAAGAGGGAGTISVGLGGNGDSGGDGGVVNATSNGTILTNGLSSSGFVAQSIGGGGGNGGFDVSSGISGAGEGAGAISVGLGGSGKGGGNGAGVTAETTGTVETHGDMSTGVLVQSVGGGGGNGGFSVAADAAGSGGGAGGVSVGLGGSAGKGGSGGVVKAKIKNNVETLGNHAAGVVTQSVGGGGGNGGFSVSGAVTGAGVGSGSVTVGLGGKGNGGGNGSMVDTTVDGSVTTQGTDAVAILAQSVGGGGGNGGFNVSGAISGSGMGSGAVSVGLGGSGGTGATGGMVTLTSNGDIRTQGARSSGFVAQSVGGGGGNGGFSIAGSAAGAGGGAGTISVGLGGNGDGGGDGGVVNATSNGTILTNGLSSSGFVAQSIGGGGGNGGFDVSSGISGAGEGAGAISVGLGGSGKGGGNGAGVTAETTGTVETHGDMSTGVLVQSVGGGGGNGGFSITPSLSGSGTGSGAISVGLGGNGAGGGMGGQAILTVKNSVLTHGKQSSAVVLQSIGGGGGNGGFNVVAAGSGAGTGSGAMGIGLGGSSGSGGTGDSVESHITGDLSTQGEQSTGLLVQSIGGGGGNGGFNVSGTITAAGKASGGVSVGIGGSGGAGGNASSASNDLTGNVTTQGTDSAGVLVQSVGGGGGNGGLNVSGTLSVAGEGSGSAAVGIGGSGGSGGSGAAASGKMSGDVFTRGNRSDGVIVQSVGGGGGNGGLNVTGTVSLSGKNSGAVGLGIGGFGGAGGSASTACNELTGNVITQGADSTGFLVQSVGGGGGNGGINVSGGLNIGGNGSGVAAVGVGGFSGNGGFADQVTGKYEGTVVTSGDRSSGIVAQSLGGGGGNGGINISGGLSVGSKFSGALGFGIGGFGGDGGEAGSVDQTVTGYAETHGEDSIGILSQSLGGGGGNGGLNVSGEVSLSRKTSAAVALGVGGFGGGGARAGELTTSAVTGGVLTSGNRSSAIVTQSLGGGGGNGGMTVSGALNLSQQNGGAASLGLGGFGGGGGNGGNVSSKVHVTDTHNNITTTGNDSIAVMAQSVGGGGGAGGLNVSGSVSLSGKSGAAVALGVGGFGGKGGDSGTVELDVTGAVNTSGNRSTGLLAQSIGGGGGVGGTNISGSLALEKPSGSGGNYSVSAGVGGFGGSGGNAGAVNLSYSGLLTALPRTVNSDGRITFNDNQGTDGVVAQSIGGGGGQGGLNVSGGIAISNKPGKGQPESGKSYGVLIGVGGFGGAGGNAGTVDVSIGTGSTILSHGSGRSGILAQSVGGGGGNGGLNVSGGIVSDTSLTVGIGGMAGNAGSADKVSVHSNADIKVMSASTEFSHPDSQTFEDKLRNVLGNRIVDTTKELVDSHSLKSLFVDLGLFHSDKTLPDTKGSAGILAQSIGGGGGNGGLNVSGGVAISRDGKIPSITFGVGGSGGKGNTSGEVDVSHAGIIDVEGSWKHGILAQSIAGGGGNGALNVSGQLNWGSSDDSGGATDLSIVGGLGGSGSTGADAGKVEVQSTGDISTKGYNSRGIFAQSIGGGGGTGGINVAAVAARDSSPVGIGIGGSGSNAGRAGYISILRGTVEHPAGVILTDGVGAHGIEASSIGGGGGDAGINAVLGISKTTGSGGDSDSEETGGSNKNVNSAVIAVGGAAGSAGDGGKVSIDHVGDIVTRQQDSHGIFAQSLGGGGGNASFNAGMIFETGDSSKNKGVGISVGGGTGNGGTGSDVTVNTSGMVDTQGDDSHGVFAQSVGGGGGNAGYQQLSAGGKEGGNIEITIGRRGGTGGSAGNVSITSRSTIQTQGSRSHGLFAQSIGNGGGNSSATSVSLTTPKNGDKTGNTFSASIGLEGGEGGKSGNVTITADTLIHTLGKESHGIFAQSVGGGGGNGGGVTGDAQEATSYSINIGGHGGKGGASGNTSVTSTARIATEGIGSIGILAQSVGGAGGTAGYTKAGTSNFSILKNTLKGTETGSTTSINIGGSGGDGMTSGDVAVSSGGTLTTLGDNAYGIMAQSVGGGGGKGGLVENSIINLRSPVASTSSISIGGRGGTGAISGHVQVTNTSDIGTQGKNAAGIFAQSVGGGGGDAQHVRNIIAGIDADNSTRNALLIGGSGGSGGSGGKVDVNNSTDARIITDGNESYGIFAQSIGGGGGNGGEVLSVAVTSPSSSARSEQGLQLGLGGTGASGGTGGEVNVDNHGLIITHGNKAHGIFAQSIGGGGGNGGYSITGNLTLQKGTKSSPGMALNIGGSGGSGNTAGTVNVTNSGEISVSGSQSYGILAQSVGGGGGNGGMAVALSLNDLVKQARGQSWSEIAVGGAGGDGADGGNVTVSNNGTIRVNGENSYGIFAQSIGGGGGNAAFSISTPAVMAADNILSTTLGAREGTRGTSGVVTVHSTGDIIVTGAGSQAVFSQSVNGGGGNVNTLFDAASETERSAGDTSTASLTSNLLLGANDVDGSNGAAVSQSHQGDIITTSDRSAGMLMQSIGGGGGLSTTTMASGIADKVTLKATLGAIGTNDSSGGEVSATRQGNVSTSGDLSDGGLAQSIGGGGGRLIINGEDSSEVSGQRHASVVLGADPSMRNNGGNIQLNLNGAVFTQGDNASGQIVQSVGAGGGEAYLTGIDHARLTLGASDGSTGNGGNISVSNTGNLGTTGRYSHGFVLQSIGGGGGLVGTSLAAINVDLRLSGDNAGNGGAINFTNKGSIVVTGTDSIGILAQSLGGGGGTVDGLFHGSAGGTGQGGNITLVQTGNILSTGERGVAVLTQSEGKDGAGKIDMALDGVIIGGSNGKPVSNDVAMTSAIMIDGGTSNTLSLSSDSFLMALNNRIISGGSGSDQITLNGRAVGNIDLGGGVNSMIVAQGGSFYAQNEINLGTAGLLHVNGNLYLGGTPWLSSGNVLNGKTTGSAFSVTQNVSQTTALTGSLIFGNTATYTPDVYFRQDTTAGGKSDLINATGDVTVAGTIIPVLNQLDRLQPLVLINAGGVTRDNGTTVIGTPVMRYEIGLNGHTGDGSSVDLIPHADFRMAGMSRNQRLTAEHVARVLSGRGSASMGSMFALIANMKTSAGVINAINNLDSQDYATTQINALQSGYRFAQAMEDCGYDKFSYRAGNSRKCSWLSLSSGRLERNPSFQEPGFRTQSTGVYGGARMPLADDFYLGFGAGFEDFSLTSGDHFSSDGRRALLGASLSKYQGPWAFYGIVNGGTALYDSTRLIDIYGTLPGGEPVSGGTAVVKQRISQANFRVGSSYRYQPAGSAAYLKPALDFDASYLHSGSASENHSDYGLQLDSTNQWILTATPSLEFGVEAQLTRSLMMQAWLRGGASFANKDDVYINATFSGASRQDGTFRNYSQFGDVTGHLDTGLSFYDTASTAHLTFGYQGQWSEKTSGLMATVNFGFRF